MAERKDPHLLLGLAAYAWSMKAGADIDGVARAVNRISEDALMADYREIFHLCRALCFAPDQEHEAYRALVEAAVKRLPAEDRRKAGKGRDLPYWLDD